MSEREELANSLADWMENERAYYTSRTQAAGGRL
jgi:hypothetical protein